MNDIYSTNEIANIGNPQEQQKMFLAKANEIALRVESVIKHIDDAEYNLKNSENVSSDWKNIFSRGIFGESKQDKINKISNESQILHMKATKELTELQEKTIRYIQSSFEIAMGMNLALGVIITQGFTTRDGYTKNLSEQARKNLETMMEFARNFIDEHKKRKQEIGDLQYNLTKQDESINQNTQIIKSHTQEIDTLHSKLREKESIDERQEKVIQDNSQKIQNIFSILDEKKAIDEKQNETIKSLEQKIAEKNNTLLYVIAIVALVASMISIVLHFVK